MTMYTSVGGLWRFYKETACTMFRAGRPTGKQDSLYANSIFLIVNAGAGAVLSFGFWVLAARLYSAESVGLGSALLSAGGLLVFISTLGLGQGLIRYLPSSQSNAAVLINSCFTLSGLIAAIVAIVFVIGIPIWSPALGFIASDVRFTATFILFVISSTLFSLFNDTYLALREAKYSFIQGLIMGLIKLVLIVSLAGLFGIFGILASWTIATAVLVLLGYFFFLVRLVPGFRPLASLQPQISGEMTRFSATNYISLGIGSIPNWVLPIIVLNQAGSEANAYFYMSWSFAGLLFAIPNSTANSLFAEGSHQEAYLARGIKRSIKLITVLAVPLAIFLAIAGEKLLLVFGQRYSEEAIGLLWLFIPGVLPQSLNVIYISAATVKKRMGEVIGITAAITIATLVLTFALVPRFGIMGAGGGWLAAQSIIALALLPRFIGMLKEKVTTDNTT